MINEGRVKVNMHNDNELICCEWQRVLREVAITQVGGGDVLGRMITEGKVKVTMHNDNELICFPSIRVGYETISSTGVVRSSRMAVSSKKFFKKAEAAVLKNKAKAAVRLCQSASQHCFCTWRLELITGPDSTIENFKPILIHTSK